LWPVLALILWTFLALLLVPVRRFRATFAGRVAVSGFLCGESARVPVVVHRFAVFAASNFVVVAMVFELALSLPR
jgi:hypothetical protein